MAGEKIGPAPPPKAEPANKQERSRSTIEFPYGDLDDAVEIANAIHNNAGTSCSPDQLAGFMKQTITSGTFRVKIGTARVFGVVETERGAISLTPLGHRIVDQNQEREARATAFLTVPLYRAVFEKFKGHLLPPAAALEREMAGFGVSPKQADKARQAFERSAEQAGFFAHGSDRLIMPTGLSKPETAPLEKLKGDDSGGRTVNGDGSGAHDPLIAALIQKLPKAGAPWPVQDRVTWLQMFVMAAQIAYGQVEPIEIRKAGEC